MTSAGVTSLTTCRAFFLGSKSSCFQPVTFSMFSLFRAEAVQWNLLHQSGQHSTTTSIQKTVRRLTALQYNTIQHEQFKDNVSNRFIIRLLSSLINWWCVSVIMLLHNIKDNTIFFFLSFSLSVCLLSVILPSSIHKDVIKSSRTTFNHCESWNFHIICSGLTVRDSYTLMIFFCSTVTHLITSPQCL